MKSQLKHTGRALFSLCSCWYCLSCQCHQQLVNVIVINLPACCGSGRLNVSLSSVTSSVSRRSRSGGRTVNVSALNWTVDWVCGRRPMSLSRRIFFTVCHSTLLLRYETFTLTKSFCFTSIKHLPGMLTGSLSTNLIHDFTAVTFSVKLAFFREKCPFLCFHEILWNPRFFVNFNTFTFIYEGFQSFINSFVRILLFATRHTSALSSWHVFTVLLTYIQSWVLT